MIPPRPREAVDLCRRHLRLLSRPKRPTPLRTVVTMAIDRIEADLTPALESLQTQFDGDGSIGVVLLIDRVGAPTGQPVIPLAIMERAWVIEARCGSAARARNTLLEFVEDELAQVRWIARLDWDDRFYAPDGLRQMVRVAEAAGAAWALAGNTVAARDGRFLRNNHASSSLLNAEYSLKLLQAMADGSAKNELPSCNVLLRTGQGFRYPDRTSAEDHWLVADLLINESARGVILAELLLCQYTQGGTTTKTAHHAGAARRSREELARAAKSWIAARALPGEWLGHGQEGVVKRDGHRVIKYFYPGALSDEQVAFLQKALKGTAPTIPEAVFEKIEMADIGPIWSASYPWQESWAADEIGAERVEAFLAACIEHSLICANVKRSNFRVTQDGKLSYIDVGRWIIPMDLSYFRDAAARLYAIGALGASDQELLRRPVDLNEPPVWTHLEGFDSFLGRLYHNHAKRHWQTAPNMGRTARKSRHDDVTLMIKACAMDAEVLAEQIRHIVDQLCTPAIFAERILLIDPFPGPFVRQHSAGDLSALREGAASVVKHGWVDRVLEAPGDGEESASVNARWFGIESNSARTALGVPVAPQLWGFEQVSTRYVLQCDVDVLIGRRDPGHDSVADMLAACRADGVLGVAFNIPHAPTAAVQPYHAPPGRFVPEVRCGLLDLQRIVACRPLPNERLNGRPKLTWYRSLEAHQALHGLRTLRGGDPATFYVHPPNEKKADLNQLAIKRDLIAQGRLPEAQFEQWDLVGADDDWQYAVRHEPLVFLARGQETTPEKVERFAKSLAMQSHQDFGVIVFDDASTSVSARHVNDSLSFLGDRLTLVRNRSHQGRMLNHLVGVTQLVGQPDALVVVLDLDDALMDRRVVGWLKEAHREGHDLILGAPFLPERPTHLYRPTFDAIHKSYGGDVWIHLRSFEKQLFERVPVSAFKKEGEWLSECTDYATMLPMAKLAQAPLWIPKPMILHERTTVHDAVSARKRDELILHLLETLTLISGNAEAPNPSNG